MPIITGCSMEHFVEALKSLATEDHRVDSAKRRLSREQARGELLKVHNPRFLKNAKAAGYSVYSRRMQAGSLLPRCALSRRQRYEL